MIVSLPNVATPATASTVVVPPSVPPSPLARARVTAAVLAVSIEPALSNRSTVGPGSNVSPVARSCGCWAKAIDVSVTGVVTVPEK